MGPREDLKKIEEEYARTQKNKATEGHTGRLKAKMAKLRAQIQMEETTSTKSFGETFDVKASGHGTVALIGKVSFLSIYTMHTFLFTLMIVFILYID